MPRPVDTNSLSGKIAGVFEKAVDGNTVTFKVSPEKSAEDITNAVRVSAHRYRTKHKLTTKQFSVTYVKPRFRYVSELLVTHAQAKKIEEFYQSLVGDSWVGKHEIDSPNEIEYEIHKKI